MRVISGQFRGTQLASLAGTKTRPTLGRVKETLFDVLAPMLPASNFLDLFSGSGAIGIEAISRQADFVGFLENDVQALEIIRKNLQKCKITAGFELYKNIARIKKRNFDIIFADPPYDFHGSESLVQDFIAAGYLKKDGIFVQEHDKKFDFANEFFYRRIDFKNSSLSFFRADISV